MRRGWKGKGVASIFYSFIRRCYGCGEIQLSLHEVLFIDAFIGSF